MIKTPNLLSYFKKENLFETTVSILKEKRCILFYMIKRLYTKLWTYTSAYKCKFAEKGKEVFKEGPRGPSCATNKKR